MLFAYFITFLAVYVQVFLLVTFLERRSQSRLGLGRSQGLALTFPSVTVIVPCYNEEETISGTVQSLLSLDYPKDRLDIFLVDDGSTDNTWQIMQKYQSHSNVKIFRKENGGKHTALNFGLERAKTEIVGCLDADSFADPQALKNLVKRFESKEIMAVVPSIIIHEPRNVIELAQKAEYELSVFVKNMLANLGALHVTPGPLSLFRKKVFEELGPYREAYNCEDAEIALRMHKHRYKIDYCTEARVYTKAPNTIKKLFKQRLRWTYGFFKNSFDYRELFFRPKYGHLAFFTLPFGLLSLMSVLFVSLFFLQDFIRLAMEKILQFKAIGLSVGISFGNFDWFYLNTKALTFIFIALYVLVIVSILIGKRLAKAKASFPSDIFYFILTSGYLAPFWILKSIYNLIIFKKPSWR